LAETRAFIANVHCLELLLAQRVDRAMPHDAGHPCDRRGKPDVEGSRIAPDAEIDLLHDVFGSRTVAQEQRHAIELAAGHAIKLCEGGFVAGGDRGQQCRQAVSVPVSANCWLHDFSPISPALRHGGEPCRQVQAVSPICFRRSEFIFGSAIAETFPD
jgi:hypothetical protein